MNINDTAKYADISPCSTYRFVLLRQHKGLTPDTMRTVIFVLNNPSIADAELDDPTATRGWGFTESWGYNRMVFINVNPHRSTDPKAQEFPTAWALEKNRAILQRPQQYAGDKPPLIVAAWGDDANPRLVIAARHWLPAPIYHLGTLTKAGNPRHILYLKGDLFPTPWPSPVSAK